jgi:hypothetical protein
MVTITNAVQHLSIWIKSCEQHVQLETCKNVLDTFINPKIYNISEYQSQSIKCELNDLIITQGILIASKTTKNSVKQRPPGDDEQIFKI